MGGRISGPHPGVTIRLPRMPATYPDAHRLPHRGDHRDALPAGRGCAHRRHLGLHRAAAARAPGEAAGVRVHEREDRQDRRAAARPRARVLRPAGRHRRGADARRHRSARVQSPQRRGDPAHDRDARRHGRLRGEGRGARRRARGGHRAGARAAPRGSRGGRASTSRNGTSRRSPASAGCRSSSASRAATTVSRSSRASRSARTASSPIRSKCRGARPTSSSGRGAARNSGPRPWRRAPAGAMCRRCAAGISTRSSRRSSCSPAPRR